MLITEESHEESGDAGIKMRLTPAPQMERWRTESDDDDEGHLKKKKKSLKLPKLTKIHRLVALGAL